jgi:hypothetical protein
MVDIFSKINRILVIVPAVGILAITVAASGCGGDEKTNGTPRTSTRIQTIATNGTSAAKITATAGIKLDPGLQSITGIPTQADMPALIDLQSKVPYPVIVPTDLPSGYTFEPDLLGYGGKTTSDPVGYYSFRYSDSSNANSSLTFNQSLSNSKPLSGYYLTEEEINGVNYQVYWHMTRKYLPGAEPVRTTSVGPAESFVVVWQGQYTDPATGQPQDLWYSIQTGSWTVSWGQMMSVLESLKPLASVAE